ncbi:class I SAM-dependent methyltransferase [Tropicimonas sp. IMCC34043]|uniref:class I SAM-dependent methyltransferase n=1 Tax=Tropicimonas sp. IMCC34043 TaxID=2248760 RepID=UPI000E252C20|nr:class I SAM-dependent methyltransferase [Tropicimonas sp. IMCC34043]
MTDHADAHGALMDGIYRYQRRIYDVTRKYYLLGRDRLIAQIDPGKDAHILEVACGTGRNLDLIGRRYPGRNLYGLDISAQMLETAQAKLGGRARLALGDACSFDPQALFGRRDFDHVVLSYSLSMIPDWRAALGEALSHVAEGGTLHLVDFGDQAGLPKVFKTALCTWLDQFHVTPRVELADELTALAERQGVTAEQHYLFRGYAQIGRIDKAQAA